MSGPGDVSRDLFLGGQLAVFQPVKGFRAGTDSVLLGAAAAQMAQGAGRAFEFGCGAGAALFVAAHHLPGAQLTGIEQDADTAALCVRGALENGLSDRVSVVAAEAVEHVRSLENSCGLVFANPPYFEPGRASAPGEGKLAAYEETASLDAWLKAMLFATRPRGAVVLIHRAAELARILARLDRQAGEIGVLPVRPFPGAEASRVIVRARKGLRTGPVRLFAGLDLHEHRGGPLTARADGVLRGDAFDWA